MSSPHSAGVSALVKSAHPDWTPEEIKSALMTSSVQSVVKEDGATPATPFDRGAGSIRADRAVNPTLVFNETYANFVAAGSDVLHRIDLNLASVDATTMSGSISTQRTAINVSGHFQNMDVSVTQPAGVTITVGNNNHALHIDKDASLTFPITIDAPNVANGQYFGSITLTPQAGGNAVYMPVAFVKKQGLVSLTNTCSPATIPASNGSTTAGLSHCTVTASNFGSTPANASINVSPLEKGRALKYKNPGAPGSLIGAGDGVQWSGTLAPAVPPQVTGFSPTTGPDGGYLNLGLLGVGPVSGVGDDTISNFTVPTFYYGGEPYTSIGVVSNGYIVVGGGTSSDIVFTPQHFPVAARPNNVLAPLWTDLNPPAGGTIRVATLSGGANAGWLVIDWGNVKNFGNATTHSFEVWIQIQKGTSTGPASEGITFSYGPNTAFPDDGPGLGNAGSGDPDSGVNWGAENRTGSSGANLASAPANGSEWKVNTTPPAAGGSVTIPFDVYSKIPAVYHSVASLTSDVTPGTTQVSQTITVTTP
jgi:hypothetical protein